MEKLDAMVKELAAALGKVNHGKKFSSIRQVGQHPQGGFIKESIIQMSRLGKCRGNRFQQISAYQCRICKNTSQDFGIRGVLVSVCSPRSNDQSYGLYWMAGKWSFWTARKQSHHHTIADGFVVKG